MKYLKNFFSDVSVRTHLKETIKEIGVFIGVILICSILIIWSISNPPDRIGIHITAIVLVALIGIVTLISYKLKQLVDLETGSPAEDEFTKLVKMHAAQKAYFLSMYFWSFLFLLNSRFRFSDIDGLLGGAIFGSALIYGLCRWYYRSKAGFNEK